MTNYDIIITSKAQSDISECIVFVTKVSRETAVELANKIFGSIESLKTLPERNPVFEMPKTFPFTIRKQIIDGRYVSLYSIEGNSVVVYRVLDSRKNFDYLII